jgi:predicted nucleic acid-binding protein
MTLFLDTNVLLDGYFQRVGAAASDALIARCDGATLSGTIAWHTLSNAFYLVRGHSKSSAIAFQFITDLLAWAEVAQTAKADALWALKSGVSDFEDALQLSAAISCAADVVITRNTSDFKSSAVPVMTPEEFLAANP